MVRKYDIISALYTQTCSELVDNPREWQSFLQSACRNYKLRCDEQVLVYAQRPYATAVLECERWNNLFGRWVNKGATGIAVFANLNSNRQRLNHYFDITDTHPTKYSRPVPIWNMEEEYSEYVIETLENSFGPLELSDNIADAIISAAQNVAEDNITDYLSDLLISTEDSFLEEIDNDGVESIYKTLVANSVAYMIMSRLNIDAGVFFDDDDFREVVNFNTPATFHSLGFAVSDISQMCLTEISKTVMALENRTFAQQKDNLYNESTKETEGSYDNDEIYIQTDERLHSTGFETATAAGSDIGQIRTDEKELSGNTPQSDVLHSADTVQTGRTSGTNRTESAGDGRSFGESDGTAGRLDGTAESREYDDVGRSDEQYPSFSTGDSESGTDLQLEYFESDNEDRDIKYLHQDDDVRGVFAAAHNLRANKDEIREFYLSNNDNDVRKEYIKSIFPLGITRLKLSDGRVFGYKPYENVLHLWEGEYENRISQVYHNWGIAAKYFEAMRLFGELYEDSNPIPTVSEQINLIEESKAEAKTSAFTLSQEIIDIVLCRGSNVSQSKMRIYEQFTKSLSSKENIEFLKNEYGWGGSSSVITGTGISEMHSGKGIQLSKGYSTDKKLLLKWPQIEKRIGELIKQDRYLNRKEKEIYPSWLEKREAERLEYAEQRKLKEILSTAPTEKPNADLIGKELVIDERKFVVERVSDTSGDVSLKDITFENTNGYPINRVEKVGLVRRLIEQQPQEQPAEKEKPTYEYHLGDTVYIGANEYEIISFNDDVVTLYDCSFPLLNKEFPRSEFDTKIAENPANDHLIVKTLPSENAPVPEPISTENSTIIEHKTPTEEKKEIHFKKVGDFYEVYGVEAVIVSKELELHLTAKTIDGLKTDMCGLPYSTLDKYKSNLESKGYTVNIIDENKPIEQIIPAWEQKPKPKKNGFDLHPEIPMAERHNFNLKEHPVEIVGKKERYHRNIEAIKVLKVCENENRFATPEEQVILSKYVGWGGIPEAFDKNNTSWANEFSQLKELLSESEYSSAMESTLTAFFTPPEVINAIYKVLGNMGFKEGNLLEPSCGIGHFMGMLPDSMKDSRIYGVELDKISAGIAQQLYQKSSIAPQGFEETVLPDSFFDGVVGNIPFGDFKLSDKKYDKHKFLIHDYFIAKSLDKLRPGGVMALITSKGTMDKENPSVRKYIAQRAELLGAIRLPNNAFKGNAGTEVVSDILFLQKRDRITDIQPDWVHLDTDENGIKYNAYFVQHPEMILGEMKMVSGRFGQEATCEAFEGSELESQLDEAIVNIHGEITEYETEEQEQEDKSLPADSTVRNFSYTIVDGEIYYRENSRMTPVMLSDTGKSRVKGMIEIRDCVRTLIEYQTENYPDENIKSEQDKLNRLYDRFSKKYGLINDRANKTAFSQDSSYSLLSALEILDDNGKLERKADMFYKRTILPHIPVTSVDTASEALAVSIGETARIDMEYMSQLTGKDEESLYTELKGVIFLNPLYSTDKTNEPKYLMADEYLSGNIREKLAVAKNVAQLNPEDYTINAEALEKVYPKDLTAGEISVRLGATWIPVDIVQQFIYEFLDVHRYKQWQIKVHYSQRTNEWRIEGKSSDKGNVKAYRTYGTSRINAYRIIEETLNLKDVRIFDYYEEDGKRKSVFNAKETAIAQAKQEQIKQAFVDWIWKDPQRRERLCRMYNDMFNSTRPREYDGSHIIFNGMNPEIQLRTHQKNAVAHILYGGNTLLAHCVGAGKTFEMIAAAQESKRLGLCNKSLIVVPNHLTGQWANEYLQLYPSANILVATKKDFEAQNRKRFCGRIATGDYDAVIIGHSQLEKIPMSVARQTYILQEQLDDVIRGIEELQAQKAENFTVKQLAKTKKSIEEKLKKLNDQTGKDQVVTFEELGVDRLFIDESHYYKNLFLYTKMRNVGGIAQTEAQKSSDLFMKCRYLDEITGNRGVVFATGTPISNSMVELYTIQRYLQYDGLVKRNLQHFDAWASTFGETITAVELTPEGTGYRAKTRFAKFYNLPELMSMFKEVADIKTADTLNLPVPKVNFHTISVKPSEMQKEILASLAERAEKVRSGGVDASVDNMLKITNDGRKLALDQRLINPLLPDYEGSKLNVCIGMMYDAWEKGKETKRTQLLFCDLSTPKNDGNFNVYDDIRTKLIAKGVPENEVAFIHDANSEAKKLELFNKVRRGDVRVLLGSTQKMGTGTNVQQKLKNLFDLDCPWRPSDLEQRLGRIVRQGNENEEVDVTRVVTEGTFDAYLYQLVEGKQKFASQIMTSKSPVRTAEDIDETALSYAEIKMLATGNPHIKEKMDLDMQVQKLRLLKSNFLSEKYDLEDKVLKVYPKDISYYTSRIADLKVDIQTATDNPQPKENEPLNMEIHGVVYAEKAAAGQAIINACKAMSSPDPIPFGRYRGFDLELSYNPHEKTYMVKIKGNSSVEISLGTDVHGNITRIDNGIKKLPELLQYAESSLENTMTQYENAKAEIEKPFAQEDELLLKSIRLAELNAMLNVDKHESEIVGGEPEESEEIQKSKTRYMER